jgi:hypothetical protein
MNINITIPNKLFLHIKKVFNKVNLLVAIGVLATLFALLSTYYSYMHHIIIAYGDSESHLNIAKRVVSSLSPGLAQLGGIWLPLPHLLMVPFVYFNFLWRSGLAGSIISGISFVVSCIFLYKLTYLITKSKLASFIAFLCFSLNPNILYMQSTPMTELPLLVFFTASTYYFMQYLENESPFSLITAGFFALLASLSRYDGWFLVAGEGIIIALFRFDFKAFFENIKKRGITLFAFLSERQEGELFLFGTLAAIGIFGWFVWDKLILGDALYFINSPFSAKSQQKGWLSKGELPSYHNIVSAFSYYFVTSLAIAGIMLFLISVIGFVIYVVKHKNKKGFLTVFLLSIPFLFNVLTLFLGQSVIFIPDLTPVGFEWRLFNARYGIMMMPTIAFFCGYLFSKVRDFGKIVIAGLLVVNLGLFSIGYIPVDTYADGTVGLSAAAHPDAEKFLRAHYDNGLVVLDDYARTVSIIGSNIPMQNIVYIGTHVYWEEALSAPQLRIKWVVMQKNDAVWKALYANQEKQGELYKYFNKVYTSKDILVFKRING